MNPLRIALVRQRYSAFGGAERFVARAVQSLQGEGADITMVTRKWDEGQGFRALICAPPYVGSLWRDWGFARCVCSTLRRHRFDLVQSHERIACCDVYRAGDGVHREWLAQRRRSLGTAARIGIALNPYHHYVMAAEKRLFHSPQLKAVICNSRMVKDEIRRYFGLPESRLHVIYSGVDTDMFHPRLKPLHREAVRDRLGIPEDATLFLFVGSGFSRKGVPALLRAIATLPASAHVLLVGRDKHLERYAREAAALNLAQRAHFVGAQQDVAPFYGAADALVLPTLYDPFPNVALEAMAAALPVITSLKSGAAELVEEGVNGYVCDALDVARLAALMTKLLLPAQREQMGVAARRTVEPLTLAAMSQELLALYHELLDEQPTVTP